MHLDVHLALTIFFRKDDLKMLALCMDVPNSNPKKIPLEIQTLFLKRLKFNIVGNEKAKIQISWKLLIVERIGISLGLGDANVVACVCDTCAYMCTNFKLQIKISPHLSEYGMLRENGLSYSEAGCNLAHGDSSETNQGYF